ncbi:MAG TPA: AraC family transcriptional regulator [Polyangia bacterium]|jgi:AraC-like DNA-binding protein|nr:AraC family transcriptional regulator [Polyangia bacterium]
MTKMTARASAGHARSSGTHSRSSGDAEAAPADPDHIAPDALSEVLQDLRLARASYCRTEMRAPWGLEIEPEDGAIVHFVIDGACWLKTPSAADLRLDAGDVVILPHGSGHVLVDEPGSPTLRLRDSAREQVGASIFRLRGGGAGARALLVCCGIAFEAGAVHPLLALMPEVMHVRSARRRDPTLTTLLDTMAVEVREQRMGAATVMARLADIIVARLVRTWVEEQPAAATGWLAAIRDPQIGAALALFHHSPERDWSVDALAAAAHLSRSQFSERFTAAIGVAPARYVASWRMHVASRWLGTSQLSVGEVASRLGYESEPAFSRAFKRITGKPPREARRTA